MAGPIDLEAFGCARLELAVELVVTIPHELTEPPG